MPAEIKIPIVYYHSVGPVLPYWYRSFLTLSPDAFRKQLEYFCNRFTVISLKELWMIRRGEISPISKPLVITFDDGYSDIWTHAFPLMKEFGVKATIFVSPWFVDERNILRSAGDSPGFLSWREMRMMEESGLVDIQSHTMTHTKVIGSDMLTGIHHPGGDIFYPAVNQFPERRTDHINDPSFETILPYGFPLFEEGSATVTRRITINPDFIEECIGLFSGYDFRSFNREEALILAGPLYDTYRGKDKLILSRETEQEYLARAREEIYGSKAIIEDKLGKRVEFLCWPHGDNNDSVHAMAMAAGYLATTRGKAEGVRSTDTTRLPDRLAVKLSPWQRKQKSLIKLKALSGTFPYDAMVKVSGWLRNMRSSMHNGV